MEQTLSSTEAVRNFGDVLAMVKHTGKSVLLTKSDKPVARIVPAEEQRSANGAAILAALHALPVDPEFGSDLERVNRLDPIPSNPWD